MSGKSSDRTLSRETEESPSGQLERALAVLELLAENAAAV